MRNWLSRIFLKGSPLQSNNGSHEESYEDKTAEIARAKATQLSILKEFAQETNDPGLINHVERREVALKRLEQEAYLLRSHKLQGGRRGVA